MKIKCRDIQLWDYVIGNSMIRDQQVTGISYTRNLDQISVEVMDIDSLTRQSYSLYGEAAIEVWRPTQDLIDDTKRKLLELC